METSVTLDLMYKENKNEVCEYCGNRIDAEKDPKCPNCGASYKKNQSFIKLEAEKKMQMQTNQENVQKVFNHVFGAFKISRIMFLIPILIFVVVFVTIVIVAFNFGEKDSDSKDNNLYEEFENLNEQNKNELDDMVEDIIGGNKEEKEIVVYGFDVFAETKDYKVKVTKYEKEEDMFNRLDKDSEYVKFYLIVENLKGERLTKEDVNCIVDGIAQTNDFSSGYSDLPMFINKGLTVKGTATFEVPKNASSYEIKYGDYVTIKISK